MAVSCPHCGQGLPIGQSQLTAEERSRLPMGNEKTKWNVVKWQVVKAAAEYYEVSDWTSEVDTSLTYEENVHLMAEKGTNLDAPGGATLRGIQP